jgi:hypothetical protein
VAGEDGEAVGIAGVGGWFDVVEVAGAGAAAIEVLGGLVAMLDKVQPQLLDPTASAVTRGRGGASPGVEIHLAHRLEDDAEIDIFIGDSDALVAWLTADLRITIDDATAGRPWTALVVDTTAAVLCGGYVVEDCYRGRWQSGRRIIDLSTPGTERVLSQSRSLLASWLPGLGAPRRHRRRLDYRPLHPPTPPAEPG